MRDEDSKFDDFDYLNGTLTDWLDKFFDQDTTRISVIEEYYLPRFERAIHLVHAGD